MAKTTKEKSYKGTKRDQYTIVLEDIRHDFRAFGEGLQALDQKVEKGFSELRADMSVVKTDILVLRSDVSVLKSDMSDVKKLLQVHDDQLQVHEERISALE